MTVTASTSGRINEEFSRLLWFHTNWEGNALEGELTEESAQFRFIRAACLTNLKGSIGLMLAKVSVMRVTIPLDLSTRSFIPLPRFIHTRTTSSLLTPSTVFLNQSYDYVSHDVWSFLSWQTHRETPFLLLQELSLSKQTWISSTTSVLLFILTSNLRSATSSWRPQDYVNYHWHRWCSYSFTFTHSPCTPLTLPNLSYSIFFPLSRPSSLCIPLTSCYVRYNEIFPLCESQETSVSYNFTSLSFVTQNFDF